VPAEAKRTSSLVGRKGRVEYGKLVETDPAVDKVRSLYNWKICYKVGEVMYPDSYSDDIRVECTNGIHVFLTKKEAERWALS
jgi:hypothetical protein